MARRVAMLFETGQRVPRPRDLAALAVKVARKEKLPGSINLIFCSDGMIRGLNREFRDLDRVTDVLSFPWAEKDLAGEIYVSNSQAKRQAKRWNNSYYNELRRLIVHGILHLCGYDHILARDRWKMREAEGKYLKNH